MRIKTLVSLHIECDPPSYAYGYSRNLVDQAKALERWCSEFHEFIRDHRSQDPINLNVVREYQDQCSHCGYEWEVDEEGVPVCCSKAEKEYLEKTNVSQC